MFLQPREVESFSERVFCLKGKELGSMWDQKPGRKVTSDRTTQWLKCLSAFVVTWEIKQINYQNIGKLLTHLCIFQNENYLRKSKVNHEWKGKTRMLYRLSNGRILILQFNRNIFFVIV